jgi:hypothetical protein
MLGHALIIYSLVLAYLHTNYRDEYVGKNSTDRIAELKGK